MGSNNDYTVETLHKEFSSIILHEAIDKTEDNIFITDADGIILYVNPAFTLCTGFLPDDVLGSTPRILKSEVHDDSFYTSLWNTLMQGKVFQGEFFNQRKNGDIYIEEKTITPIIGRDDEITHFVSVGRDVTQLRERLQNELSDKHQEAIKDLMIATHHDLLTPLTIMNLIAFQLEQSSIGDNHQEKLDKLKAEMRYLERLANNILILSSLRSYENIEFEYVAMDEVLDPLISRIEVLYSSKNMCLQYYLPPKMPQIRGNPNLLERLFLNLMENSIKYSDEDTTVKILGWVNTTHLNILIADQGKGINPKLLPHVFNKYYQEDTMHEGNVSGVGLGLYIVQIITELHNGKIEIESEVNEGTQIKLSFPLLK